ncbi:MULTISPECIES: glutaredoxin family protein [unclassified Agrococcus]|uniref:glutaredoxin family protein n=1 Tax=unclassified Agrococcus TaxID=2615065 RepID=UPI00361BD1D1
MVEVTLVAKPGCHLCDVARPVVEGVVAEFADARLVELDMTQDAALAERWSEDVPVVLIDGRPHASWRVDADRLRDRIGRALG